MRGYDSNYVPGWDCHGLPIEWKIEEQYRAKGKNKDEVPVNEFRKECRDFAAHWIKVQARRVQAARRRGRFRQPLHDDDLPRRGAHRRRAAEIRHVAASSIAAPSRSCGRVVERTALAEAEVEYQDYESDTIWVKFPVRRRWRDGHARATLPTPSSSSGRPRPGPSPATARSATRRAIAYGLYEVDGGRERLRPAAGREADLCRRACRGIGGQGQGRRSSGVADVSADELAALTLAHPLARAWAAATSSPSRCSPAITSPTMPAPASCTPRPATAARTSTPGWTRAASCASARHRHAPSRSPSTMPASTPRTRRASAGPRGRRGARHRRQRQEGRRQQGASSTR